MPENSKEHRIVTHVNDIYMALLRKWQGKREAAEKTLKMLKGGDDSWDSAILEMLKEAKMPHLNLNIMLPIMMRIFGAEMNRRGKLKGLALNDAALNNATVITSLFEVIESHYQTMEQFGMAFKQAVTLDLPGWVRLKWSYTRDPLGMPEPEFLNTFYIMLGEHSKKDLSDCRELTVSWFITKEEVIDAFPDKQEEINKYYREGKRNVLQRLRDSVAQLFGGAKERAQEQMFDRDGNIRIIELYERNTETEFLFVKDDDPYSLDVLKIPANRVDEFKAQRKDATFIKRKRDIMTVTTVLGDQVLLQEKTPLPIQNNKFPFFPVWGLNVDGDHIGLGRQLEGPMEEYQKSRSAELQIIGTGANSGWQYEDGAYDPEEEKKLQTSGGAMGLLLKHKLGRQKAEKITPQYPPIAMQNRSLQAKDDAQFISGVGPNPLGRKETPGESGKLFESRVEEFIAILGEFFVNLRHGQEWCGDYMIDMLKYYLGTNEREFTNSETGETFIVNEEVSPLLPGVRIRDISTGSFAAKSEVSPNTLTQRREIANILLQALQYTQDERLQPLVLKLLFEKLELPDEERQQLVQAASALVPPSAMDQLEAAMQVEQFAGQSGQPVEPVDVT